MCRTKNCWLSIDAHLKDLLSIAGCSTIAPKLHNTIIDIQYIVSMYIHFHPNTSMTLCFWAATIHGIWAMLDIGPLRFSAFGRQFIAYRSIYQFLIYLARLVHLSLSSSFSSISMTYHKQFSKSRPGAAVLGGELCSWMHARMPHDSHQSSGFRLRIDHYFYDSYDSIDLNFVSTFGL